MTTIIEQGTNPQGRPRTVAVVGDLTVELIGTGDHVETFVDVDGDGIRSWAGHWHTLSHGQRERLADAHTLHTALEVGP